MIGAGVVLMILMMRKMNQTMGADKSLSFGKAKFKKADDKRKTTFADVAGADEEKEELKEALKKLSDRERKIMFLRFGLGGGEEMTQKEVATYLGISQSYISRLEKKIIAKLKCEIESEG